jgi:hypothetical protein
MTIREVELFAMFAAIAAFWAQIKSVADWPRRWFVVKRQVGDQAAAAILGYLRANAMSSARDGSFYRGERVHVRPIGRVCLVFAESLINSPQLFWLRRRPIWYSMTRTPDHMSNTKTFSFLRGMDWERLLGEVAKWDDSNGQVKTGKRHYVRVHGGIKLNQDGEIGSPRSTQDSDEEELSSASGGVRLLHWDHDDIGHAPPLHLGQMSLRPEIESVVQDVGRFMESRDWCEERGIPWRRGWLLGGPPGTGKTSLVRGVGVEHDLPVHIFDLGSMENMGLRHAWSQMVQCTPCIALIEDIHAIYDGCKQRSPGVGPTFDCLLNCIGGMSSADGVLVFVTTNQPEIIDPALGRGGRLDVHVEFKTLDSDGAAKMVRRILGEDPEDLRRVVEDPEVARMTPADLQEKLCKVALARRFGDAA